MHSADSPASSDSDGMMGYRTHGGFMKHSIDPSLGLQIENIVLWSLGYGNNRFRRGDGKKTVSLVSVSVDSDGRRPVLEASDRKSAF